MIDIADAVREIMATTTEITDLVGTRIYNDQLPQTNDGDAIVFRVISGVANMSLIGATGIDQEVFQIEAYSTDRSRANDIAQLIWIACDLPTGNANWAGVEVRGITRVNPPRYLTDRVKHGTDQHRFITSQDLMFTYYSLPITA